MKIAKFLPLAFLAFALAGCSSPFAPPGKNATVAYVNEKAQVMQASQDIDDELTKKMLNAKAQNLPFDKLASEVLHAKNAQQDLYDSIRDEKSPNGNDKVKYLYLNAVNSRINSYAEWISIASDHDYDAFTAYIALHKAKDGAVMKKNTESLNSALRDIKEKERDSILPLAPVKKK